MQPHTRFGPYVLERLLGQGGMGQVWLAFDSRTERPIALKVLPPAFADDDDYRQRFLREAKVAAGLREPHVVPIHSFGEIEGQLYIDMAFIEGNDVGSMLKAGGPLPPARAVDVIAQAADALDAAHDAGLVHRDVKPSNLLVTDRKSFVYLIDFGIAHGMSQSRLTSSGLSVGTLEYMAPERFLGDFDASVDVYALACVLFHCLVGKPPFGNTTPVHQMHAHISTPPPRASDTDPAIPQALDDVIARGMAKNPADRYPTAGDLGAAARVALAESARTEPQKAAAVARVLPPPVTRVELPPRVSAPLPRRRLDVRWLAFGAFLVVLVGALAWVAVSARSVSDDPPATPATATTTTVMLGPPALIATVPVGDGPLGIAADPVARLVYVAVPGDSTIVAVDMDSLQVASRIALPGEPAGVAADARAGLLYAVLKSENAVAMIDPRAGAVLRTFPVGQGPWDVTVDSATGKLYVTNEDDDTVTVVDPATGPVATIAVGDNPLVAQADSATRSVYVSNKSDDTVSVVDTATDTVVATLAVGDEPNGIAIEGSSAYVTNRLSGSVSVIDTAARTVVGTILVGHEPLGVAIDSAAHTAYVTNAENGWVATVDTFGRTVTGSYDFADLPIGVVVDPDTHRAFVTSYDSDALSVIGR